MEKVGGERKTGLSPSAGITGERGEAGGDEGPPKAGVLHAPEPRAPFAGVVGAASKSCADLLISLRNFASRAAYFVSSLAYFSSRASLLFLKSARSSFSFTQSLSCGVVVVRGKDPRARNEDRGDAAKSERRSGIARGDALGETVRMGVNSSSPRRPLAVGLGRDTRVARIVRGVIMRYRHPENCGSS